MRVTEGRTLRLSADEAYERFFDGYYNLGRPGEIFDRNVVVSHPKAEVVEAPVREAKRRVRRARRSIRRLTGV